MLHDGVVTMGVYADVVGVAEAELQHGSEDSMGGTGSGNAVDDMVGVGVVNPCALVDFLVGGLRGGDEGECAGGYAVITDDVADTALNVLKEYVGRGVAIGPLVEIATFTHRASGIIGKAQQCGNICLGGKSDGADHIDVWR